MVDLYVNPADGDTICQQVNYGKGMRLVAHNERERIAAFRVKGGHYYSGRIGHQPYAPGYILVVHYTEIASDSTLFRDHPLKFEIDERNRILEIPLR